MGGLDKLLETLRQRIAEQKGRHQGGSKWIGTGGTSPYGANGYNPEGVRIGQDRNRNFRAVKVWDRREFKDLDDAVELGTRNIKIALRRLRKFARTGAAEELDLDGTIKGTARKGYLDILLRPGAAQCREGAPVLRRRRLDGLAHPGDGRSCSRPPAPSSSTWSISISTTAFTRRCGSENRRRFDDTTPTHEVLRTYPHDYKVIFVGDAAMSPYEISAPGGSVEHFNEEPGTAWMERVTGAYRAAVWLNPLPERDWDYTQSIRMMRQLMGGRMYPLTLEGLDRAMRELVQVSHSGLMPANFTTLPHFSVSARHELGQVGGRARQRWCRRGRRAAPSWRDRRARR